MLVRSGVVCVCEKVQQQHKGEKTKPDTRLMASQTQSRRSCHGVGVHTWGSE